MLTAIDPHGPGRVRDQAAALADLDAALDDVGGSVTLDLITTLVLARRV